jgi:hypothetical protein
VPLRTHLAAAGALLALTAFALPAALGAQAPRAVSWERSAWKLSAHVPTDSLARLVATALDAPPARDQELFDAITCQLFQLDWVYGVEATDLAAARMIDSLLPTPKLRTRFMSVQERWPASSQSWQHCSVRDLPPSTDDLSIERPAPAPKARATPRAPASAPVRRAAATRPPR